MFVCQLPQNIQDEIKKDLRDYIDTYLPFEYTTDEKEEAIEAAMNEKLVNILNVSDEAMECGLSLEKYGAYIK